MMQRAISPTSAILAWDSQDATKAWTSSLSIAADSAKSS
jgi:hypothetical protein